MSIKRTNVTRQDVERWIRQGRGQGEGQSYLPWIGVRDFPTRGRAFRPHGLLTGRRHHLLSRIELGHFLRAESNPSVLDIREQVALLPLDRTMEIARELGVVHPRFPVTRVESVMTTDLVVTRSGTTRLLALSIKPKAVFEQEPARVRRILEKLSIERSYWESRGHEWRLATDAQVTPTYRYNLLRIRPSQTEWKSESIRGAAGCAATELSQLLRELPLKRALEAWGRRNSEPFSRAWQLFGFAAWQRLLPIDLEQKISWDSYVMEPLDAMQLAA